MKFTRPQILCIEICCLILSLTSTLTFWVGTATAQNRSKTPQPNVTMVGTPRWWIVPRQEGNTSEGRLYFGAVLQNNLDVAVKVGLSFQAYIADGTRYSGCYSPGGGGPGVTEEIAPHEKALLVCNRSIVPRDMKDLQVTIRLWDAQVIKNNNPNAQIVESGLLKLTNLFEKESSEYDAFARVKTLTSRDTNVYVLIRFYSEDGIQVATCESQNDLVEAEVTLRMTCGVHVFVDAGSPKPKTVRAEVKGIR